MYDHKVPAQKKDETRLRTTMPSWDDDELAMAAEVANAILSKALAFSTGGGEAFRHLLIAQHVKIQLAYLNNPCPLSEAPGRAAMALEALAKAHADGVRVKTAQPWHKEE